MTFTMIEVSCKNSRVSVHFDRSWSKLVAACTWKPRALSDGALSRKVVPRKCTIENEP